jgi:HSP20 family molecular chaperone IbpA
MPGVDKKDIKVSLENGYLTVSYSIDSSHKDKKHLHVERRSGTYRREYFVGYEAKKDEIGEFEHDDIFFVVQGEMEYTDTLE